MIDPLLSLAFSMHSNRGAYAVLLGSGISRAAEIPTGWEIVLDLTRKLAALRGEDCAQGEEAWYTRTFGEPPDYSKLLQRIAKKSAERQSLLRGYFEPNEDDIPVGRKQATAAHEALADLVKSGHVRVILTTNFDRLIERSLENVGVHPVVVSTPNGLDGVMPLAHGQPTVIKLHGDYLDARIKNTPEELAKYDRRVNRMLDRILDRTLTTERSRF